MRRTLTRRALLGLGLLVGVGACGGDSPLQVDLSEPLFHHGDTFHDVTVCKTGPAGTSADFTVSMAGGLVGDLKESAFELSPGGTEPADADCRLVWRGETAATLTITETPGPGTRLDEVFVNQVEQIPVSHTVTVSVGSVGGAMILFKNVEGPALRLEKLADRPVVNAGNPISFTISVSNAGPGTANQVTLADPLPGGTGIHWEIQSSDPSCTISGSSPQTLNCSFGDMAAGTSRSVQVRSETTLQTCAEVPNTASASASNHATVTATATVRVECQTLPLAGCTPGFWQGRNNGALLWDTQPDAQWTANGGAGDPPFTHGVLFNSFFAPHPALNGKTMYDLIRTGGGSIAAQKAARSLVATYLNTAIGINTGYVVDGASPAGLRQRWAAAVAAGDADLNALHSELDQANNRGTCGLTANAGR